MRNSARGSWLGIAAATITLLGSGCARSPAVPVDVTPAPTETPVADAGNLPPGCSPIDLRTPAGERIELDGTWAEVGSGGELLTWWIRTQGNCVWGAGSIDNPSPAGTFEARPDHVQSLRGVLGSDFVITGEIVWLGALPLGAPGVLPPYSPLRMFVEFDDAGEIFLREDREPGVTGPHCPDPSGFCPAPLVLQRVD
jgi:hypothetical protein